MFCFLNSREAPRGSDCFSPYVGEVVWGRRMGAPPLTGAD